ncbi:MAG: HAD family hydrolase [Elusimicrobiales bacterium]
MLESIAAYLGKWYARLKAFSMLAGAWGFLFSVNSLIGFQAGFEYDDGLVYSTPAFRAAENDKLEAGTPDYWNAVNRSYGMERLKPVPWLAAWSLKAVGVKIAVFCDRGPEGGDSLEKSWRRLADYFYFSVSEDHKYRVLEKRRFVLYAGASDSGIIQARKAAVPPLRLRKSPKSSLPFEYTPGKFGERGLPLSGF